MRANISYNRLILEVNLKMRQHNKDALKQNHKDKTQFLIFTHTKKSP